MYGHADMRYPQRVVCLTAAHVETCFALGAGSRVVGVPDETRRPPAARDLPRVGEGASVRADGVLALEPDLVLAFSDMQADVTAELVRAGLPVYCSNPRSVDEILRTILSVGGLLGLEREARGLVQDMSDEIRQIREFSSVWPDRPRVFFEEWPDPLTAGVGWVSEAVEIAGGRDIFSELRPRRSGRERVVHPGEVVRRDPEIILAAWRGRPVDLAAIRARRDWESVSAVREGRLHEVPGEDILSPGPSLLHGLRAIHEIVQEHVGA